MSPQRTAYLTYIFIFLSGFNAIYVIQKFHVEILHLITDNIRELLSLFAIVSAGILGGNVADSVGVDSMLGMLLAGVLVKNIFYSILVDVPHSWTSVLWVSIIR